MSTETDVRRKSSLGLGVIALERQHPHLGLQLGGQFRHRALECVADRSWFREEPDAVVVGGHLLQSGERAVSALQLQLHLGRVLLAGSEGRSVAYSDILRLRELPVTVDWEGQLVWLWISGFLTVAVVIVLVMALLMRLGSTPAKHVLFALALGNAGFFNGIQEGLPFLLWWQLWMSAHSVPYMVQILRSRALSDRLHSPDEVGKGP